MTHFDKFAVLKIATLQAATQATLMSCGVSLEEASLATCALAALAPLYSTRAAALYRAAFRRAG